MSAGIPSPGAPPFPTLLPYQVLHYPIPQLMKAVGPRPAAEWPPRMDRRVAAWQERTSHLPSSGNQIYLHVPFCPFFCHFCPLYKTKDPADRGADRREQFVQRLIREIDAYGRMASLGEKTFNTVYFGGGTPTELTPDQLGRILDTVRRNFRLASDVEITLEGVVSQMIAPGYLAACVERGFNRLSFGVQTLDPTLRRAIGRGEDVADYHRLIELARRDHPRLPINLDLMAGLPGQTRASHESDLRQSIAWGVGSVDIYAYWMVPGTRLFDFVGQGRRAAPIYGDNLLRLRLGGKRILGEAGYRQVTGEAYVKDDPDLFMKTTFGGGGNALNTALAFGPSAIGFMNGTLYRNVCDLKHYMEQIDAGLLPVERAETLDLKTARRRALLFGLQRLNVPDALVEGERRHFERWEAHDLVALREGTWHLTEKGSAWYNMMQFAMLPAADLLRMSGILGSAGEQSRAFARDLEDMDDLTLEVLALIRESQDFRGTMRLFGYKTWLRVQQLPFFDRRSVGFSGRVEAARPVKESPVLEEAVG